MPGVAAEGGANVRGGEAVGKRANTRAWGRSQELFQPRMLSWGGRRICDSGSGGGRGRKCVRRRSGRKTRKRMPRRSAWSGISEQDHRGRIRVSERTRSGAGHCSERGRVFGGKHCSANTLPCLAVLDHFRETKKNRLRRFLVYTPPAPMIGPFHAANIMFFLFLKINNICGIKRPNHRGGWRVHQKSSKSIFLWRRRKWPGTAGTAAYLRCSACT